MSPYLRSSDSFKALSLPNVLCQKSTDRCRTRWQGERNPGSKTGSNCVNKAEQYGPEKRLNNELYTVFNVATIYNDLQYLTFTMIDAVRYFKLEKLHSDVTNLDVRTKTAHN